MMTLEALQAGRALLIRPYGVSWGGAQRGPTNDGWSHCSVTALQRVVRCKDGTVDKAAYDGAYEALSAAIPIEVDYYDRPLKRLPVSRYHDSLKPHVSHVVAWWDRAIAEVGETGGAQLKTSAELSGEIQR